MIHTRVGRVGGLGCVLQWRGPSRGKRVQCNGRGGVGVGVERVVGWVLWCVGMVKSMCWVLSVCGMC